MRHLWLRLTSKYILLRNALNTHGCLYVFRLSLWRYSRSFRIRYSKRFFNRQLYEFEGRSQEAPLLSIVIPIYKPRLEHLMECMESIMTQNYTNWELCLCDDASNSPDLSEYLEHLSRWSGRRVKVCVHKENQGIAAATNSAIGLSSGEIVVFMDNDDLLTPDALSRVAQKFVDERCDFVYTDEDKLLPDGTLSMPFTKPEKSISLLLSCNYVSHLSAVSRRLGEQIGWLRPEFDGSQDYDLTLRVFSDRDAKICHIPSVCYHWRVSETSVAANPTAKPYAYKAAKAAIDDYMAHRGIDAFCVDSPGRLGHYDVRLKNSPKCLVLIDLRGKSYAYARRAINRLLMEHLAYDVRIILDNKAPRSVRYLVSQTDLHVSQFPLELDIDFDFCLYDTCRGSYRNLSASIESLAAALSVDEDASLALPVLARPNKMQYRSGKERTAIANGAMRVHHAVAQDRRNECAELLFTGMVRRSHVESLLLRGRRHGSEEKYYDAVVCGSVFYTLRRG